MASASPAMAMMASSVAGGNGTGGGAAYATTTAPVAINRSGRRGSTRGDASSGSHMGSWKGGESLGSFSEAGSWTFGNSLKHSLSAQSMSARSFLAGAGARAESPVVGFEPNPRLRAVGFEPAHVGGVDLGGAKAAAEAAAFPVKRQGVLSGLLARTSGPDVGVVSTAEPAVERKASLLSSELSGLAVERGEEASLPDDLRYLRRHWTVFSDPLVVQAYEYAQRVYIVGEGDAEGEGLLAHFMGVAKILASLGMDATTVSAGILHGTIDNGSSNVSELKSLFGAEVASLVGGVMKMTRTGHFIRQRAQKELSQDEVQNLRDMYVAMSDTRVVITKLCCRLQALREINSVDDPDRKVRAAKEALEVWAPLAGRLGIKWIKEEMQKISFPLAQPEAHAAVVLQAEAHTKKWESWLNETTGALRNVLEAHGIQAKISARQKSLYSIHGKLERKGKTFEQVDDIRALRILVKNKEDCYRALRIAHDELWEAVDGTYKDYIAFPKSNGYQSLHTVVTGVDDLRLELQFRTEAMDDLAENGIAAHWRYKESPGSSPVGSPPSAGGTSPGSGSGNSRRAQLLDLKIKWCREMLRMKADVVASAQDHEEHETSTAQYLVSTVRSSAAADSALQLSASPDAGRVLSESDFFTRKNGLSTSSDFTWASLRPKAAPGHNVVVVTGDGSIRELPPRFMAKDLLAGRSALSTVSVNGTPVGPEFIFHDGDVVDVTSAAVDDALHLHLSSDFLDLAFAP